jgi:hypothetical protein
MDKLKYIIGIGTLVIASIIIIHDFILTVGKVIQLYF